MVLEGEWATSGGGRVVVQVVLVSLHQSAAQGFPVLMDNWIQNCQSPPPRRMEAIIGAEAWNGLQNNARGF